MSTDTPVENTPSVEADVVIEKTVQIAIDSLQAKENLTEMIAEFETLPIPLQVAVREKMLSDFPEEEKEHFNLLQEGAVIAIQAYPKWILFTTTLRAMNFPEKGIKQAENLMANHLCTQTILLQEKNSGYISPSDLENVIDEIVYDSISQFVVGVQQVTAEMNKESAEA